MKTKTDFGQHQPVRLKRYPDVVARIKIVIAELKLTQEEVADTLGTHQPYLSHILKENKPFSVEHILNFAEAYNVNLNWLLLGNQENKFLSSKTLSEKEKKTLFKDLQKMNSESAAILEKLLK